MQHVCTYLIDLRHEHRLQALVNMARVQRLLARQRLPRLSPALDVLLAERPKVCTPVICRIYVCEILYCEGLLELQTPSPQTPKDREEGGKSTPTEETFYTEIWLLMNFRMWTSMRP